MQHKRRKGLFHTLRQFFHRRNIIIVSDKAVEHYPINGTMQVLVLIAVIGGFSLISYTTGSYMSAQSVLEEKDRQIFSTTLKNKQMDEEYALLKRDLLKLKESKGQLDEYAQFVIKQHAEGKKVPVGETLSVSPEDGNVANELLLRRIAYLEGHIDKLRDENTQIVTAVQQRTKGKIKELQEVINIAGLKARTLEKRAKKELAALDDGDQDGFDNQGGPYIPENLTSFGEELFADIDQMMLLDKIVGRLPLDQPMESARKTSSFGHRIDPFTKRWAMHSGMDFAGKKNAGVRTPADGKVIFAGRKGAYGNFVEIDHGMGVTTRYGHLSKITVREGEAVVAEQKIGNQGSTGRSTGQHLHYEVRFNGQALNPKNFLKAGQYAKKQER